MSKNKEIYGYILFGLLTTGVYYVVRFFVLSISQDSVLSAIFAQVISVIFAFIVNKKYVFNNKLWDIKNFFYQLLFFSSGRFLVAIIDIGLSYVILKQYDDVIINFFGITNIYVFAGIQNNLPINSNFLVTPKYLLEFLYMNVFQILAIIINYFFSKYYVFKNEF